MSDTVITLCVLFQTVTDVSQSSDVLGRMTQGFERRFVMSRLCVSRGARWVWPRGVSTRCANYLSSSASVFGISAT